jgi:hypothetical protein
MNINIIRLQRNVVDNNTKIEIIFNTINSFSIKSTTWWWPARVETCGKRKENIQISSLGCTVMEVVYCYVNNNNNNLKHFVIAVNKEILTHERLNPSSFMHKLNILTHKLRCSLLYDSELPLRKWHINNTSTVQGSRLYEFCLKFLTTFFQLNCDYLLQAITWI